MQIKLIRITTVPISLKILLKGQHRFMSTHGIKVIGVASNGEELEEVALSEGIEVKAIEMSRKITPLNDLVSLCLMYKFLKKEKPHIVHTHTPKAGTIGMLAAKLANIPIRLHTVAGLPLMEAIGTKRKVLDFVEKFTYSCATKVYPNSKGLYDFILKNNFTSKDKLHIIGNASSNGIDTSFFSKSNISLEDQNQLKNNLSIAESDFVYIFVGRLVGDKGVNELVEAFLNLKRDNVKLLLVGSYESELYPLKESSLIEINNNPNIICVGFQNDVRPYFAISNALVFPSYREGFPNAVMQAGAMELPSIVSDINGCNEIIIENKNGIIIPVKNSKLLFEAMEKLCNDLSYYEQLKENSRPMITSRFEQQIVWNAILEEYKMLLSKQSK